MESHSTIYRKRAEEGLFLEFSNDGNMHALIRLRSQLISQIALKKLVINNRFLQEDIYDFLMHIDYCVTYPILEFDGYHEGFLKTFVSGFNNKPLKIRFIERGL